MEFVPYDCAGRMNATAKRKVRTAAMRVYRQRLLKDSRAKSPTQERGPPIGRDKDNSTDEADGNRLTIAKQKDPSPGESGIKALQGARRAFMCATEGISSLGRSLNDWPSERWSPHDVNTMFGLFGSYYRYLGQDGHSVSYGISQAWAQAPSPMLLSALVLSSYGSIMAVNESLPLGIDYRLKGTVLKELSMRANSPSVFDSGPVTLTLLSLCSYEQSIISDEARIHLRTLRHMLDSRGGARNGAVTHCHHLYVMLDITDIALATWRNETPTLSDIGDSQSPSRTLVTHMSALSALLIAEVYELGDESQEIRNRLRGLPKLLLQVQTYLDGAIDADEDDFASLHDCTAHIESFIREACPNHLLDKRNMSDAELVALAIHRSMTLISRISTDHGSRPSRAHKAFAQDLMDCVTGVEDATWRKLPFLTYFVFLTTGLVVGDRGQQSRCRAVLLQTLHAAPAPLWFKLRSLAVHFYHVVRAIRRQVNTASPSPSISPCSFKPSTGDNMALHPKLRARVQADQKFYGAAEEGGTWVDLNQKLARLLVSDG